MSGRLVDVDRLITPAVAETITHLELAESDAAAVRLAHVLAHELDALQRDPEHDPATVDRLAGRLLTVLESLGATPRARAAIKGGNPVGGSQKSPLAALRDAR